ncbi:MAG: hypothetical protein PUB32_04200 [Clostridiales bacterium]|nr:hypothetical protein [Clostridiales bacterium]
MKKKLPAILFVAVFLLVCAVPSLGFLAFGPAKAGANERLAAKPQLIERDGGINSAYLSQLSEYFAGHFFLRQEMISANNAVTALLGASAEEDVILGSGGWLYYAETLPGYTGTERLSDAELRAAAKNLSLMQEYCEASGADFLFTIAPNKNSLYPGNMPDYGAAAAERDAQRLLALCGGMNIDCLDLFKVFEAQDEVLYFAHDSHWNSQGAALAADSINAAFGRESAYFDGDFSASVPHTGDLFEMLYPAGKDKETDPQYSPAIELEYEGSGVRPDSISIVAHGGGEGRLLAYRDSFGNNLYPYLADGFETARFSRATSYDLTGAGSVDCVLIELVERNIDYLVQNVPVMPAPERAVPSVQKGGEVSVIRSEGGKAPEGCVLVEGSLGEIAGEVYIMCENVAYEAFLQQDGGFAAYIPADAGLCGIIADGVYFDVK